MERVIVRTVGPHFAVFMLVNALRSGITCSMPPRPTWQPGRRLR